MISVEEALERLLSVINALDVVQVPLAESSGLVLAEDVEARDDSPPFANSAMYGFALLSRDSRLRNGQPSRLRVTGGVPAGYVAEDAVEEGTAMRRIYSLLLVHSEPTVAQPHLDEVPRRSLLGRSAVRGQLVDDGAGVHDRRRRVTYSGGNA